jgi:putative resolvase
MNICYSLVVKLAEWVRRNGVLPRTGYDWFREGTMPVPARRLPSGTIMVKVIDDAPQGQVVVYAGCRLLTSAPDLDRQVAGVTAFTTGQQMVVSRVVTEVGSALNEHRKQFPAPLRKPAVTARDES